MDVAAVSPGVNVVVLLALSTVWARDYLTFRSEYVVGLLVPGVFLLTENTLVFHMYIFDPTLSGWFNIDMPVIAQRLMMLLHASGTAGLAFLAWIAFDWNRCFLPLQSGSDTPSFAQLRCSRS